MPSTFKFVFVCIVYTFRPLSKRFPGLQLSEGNVTLHVALVSVENMSFQCDVYSNGVIGSSIVFEPRDQVTTRKSSSSSLRRRKECCLVKTDVGVLVNSEDYEFMFDWVGQRRGGAVSVRSEAASARSSSLGASAAALKAESRSIW